MELFIAVTRHNNGLSKLEESKKINLTNTC